MHIKQPVICKECYERMLNLIKEQPGKKAVFYHCQHNQVLSMCGLENDEIVHWNSISPTTFGEAQLMVAGGISLIDKHNIATASRETKH